MKIIDSHAHLNDEKFLNEEEKIVKNFKDLNGEYIVIPGYDLESSKRAVQLAKKYNQFALVGIHPNEAIKYTKEQMDEDLKIIDELASEDRVVGIGEIGYDFYWDKKDEAYLIQKYLLERQIQIANKHNLPISIHTREATNEIIATLKENNVIKKGIFHCCPLNEYLVKEGQKLGFLISFSGIITFKSARENAKKIINMVDINNILIETDSPYLAPEPYRGKMNEPAYVIEVAKQIALSLNRPLDEILNITSANAKRIYEIKDN